MGRIYSASNTGNWSLRNSIVHLKAVTVPCRLREVYCMNSNLLFSEHRHVLMETRRIDEIIATSGGDIDGIDPGDPLHTANIDMVGANHITGTILRQEVWTVTHEYLWRPPPALRPIVKIGEIIQVSISEIPTGPTQVGFVCNLVFEEFGA